MLLVLPLFLAAIFRSSSQIDDALISLAVENKNAEQIINEFTFNWTLDRNDVVADRNRQLTLLSKSPYYTEKDESSMFLAGQTKADLTRMIEQFQLSKPFEQKLQRVLTSNCPLFVDEEFRLMDDKVLMYSRVGFIRQNPDLDKFILVRDAYSAQFPNLPKDTQTFLECVGQFRADETKCPSSNKLSRLDWFAYKIWMRANAITTFMGIYASRRESILSHVRELLPYLPPTYQPVIKCDLEPSESTGCDAIFNPKLGILLGLAETLNYTVPTSTDLFKIKRLLNGDAVERTKPTLHCQEAGLVEVGQLLDTWTNKGYINHLFATGIINSIGSRRIDDIPYFVGDFLFSEQANKKKVYFARVFILVDNLSNGVFRVGASFVKLTTKLDVQVLEAMLCHPESQYCSMESVQFATNDALLKKYVVYEAVNALTSQKTQQPDHHGWIPWNSENSSQ